MNCSDINMWLGLDKECRYEQPVFPPALQIMAGLDAIPRQRAGFSGFRDAMLMNLRRKMPLKYWKAREGNDPGIMLLEMWAYICDCLSFYDEVIANELYTGTARQRSSLVMLAARVGYRPRPAVASLVKLAGFAEGSQLVKIPAGTSFRSGAFDGNPPQVFETTRDILIHPFTNKWEIEPPVDPFLSREDPPELLINPEVPLKPEMILLLVDSGDDAGTQVTEVSKVTPYITSDKKVLSRLAFRNPLKLARSTPVANLTLLLPGQTAQVKRIEISSSRDRLNTLVLDKLYPGISSGDHILVSRGKEFNWFSITDTGVDDIKATRDVTVKIDNHSYFVPGSTVEATKITVDRKVMKASASENKRIEIAITGSVAGEFVVHFGMRRVGRVVNEPARLLYSTGTIPLQGKEEKPPENFNPGQFLIRDGNDVGYAAKGTLEYENRKIILNQEEGWDHPLAFPAEVCGNCLDAVRGESVYKEVLGSGDASLVNQTFRLRKKPLTYLFSSGSDDDMMVKSMLEVRVGGILWSEVPGFFNTSGSDRVYIVRQDDESESTITFGDGIRGQRLPSGISNVVASYRFGAGKPVPPAHSLTQVATPVKGLKSVLNPVAPCGGEDRETSAEIRSALPKAAMLLNRIISIKDAEAAVVSVPGVRSICVDWEWSKVRQVPMVHIYYIGEDGIRDSIVQFLHANAGPEFLFTVERALPKNLNVRIDLHIDSRHDKEEMIKSASHLLLNPVSGILSPEVAGIGKPVFRSRIYKALISLPGILGVGTITWNGFSFTGFAKSPERGCYFDIDETRLYLKGMYTQP